MRYVVVRKNEGKRLGVAIINLKDLCPGMVLAEDAKLPNGRVLLESGCELDDANIRLFKVWGLIEADIKDVDRNDVEMKQQARFDEESMEKVRKQFAILFSKTDRQHPMIAELFRLCVLNTMIRNEASSKL